MTFYCILIHNTTQICYWEGQPAILTDLKKARDIRATLSDWYPGVDYRLFKMTEVTVEDWRQQS